MAVLNGQPVMWKGDRWGTPPSEAVGVPAPSNSNWQDRIDARRSGTSSTPRVEVGFGQAKGKSSGTPPVGQMAVLNGQPVMWKGDRWGTPPSEAVGVPAAGPDPRIGSGNGGPPPSAPPARTAPVAGPGPSSPPPVQQSSGFTTPRINPMTGAAMQAPGPSLGGAAATFSDGQQPFSREALEASVAGNDVWTNPSAIDARYLSPEKVTNTSLFPAGSAFGEMASNEFNVPGQFVGGPGQPPAGFGMDGQLAGVPPEGMIDGRNVIGQGGTSIASAGFSGLDLTGGAQPAIDIVEAPGGATPEDAAQNMANATAGNVMSLQEMIRNRRVNLDG